MRSNPASYLRVLTVAILAACLGACTEEPDLNAYTFEGEDAAVDSSSNDAASSDVQAPDTVVGDATPDATPDATLDATPDVQVDTVEDVASADASDTAEDVVCEPQCLADSCGDDGCGGTCACAPDKLCHPGSLSCVAPGYTEEIATWSNGNISEYGRKLIYTQEALAWVSDSSLYYIPHQELTTLDCSSPGICNGNKSSKEFSEIPAVASKLGQMVTTSIAVSKSKVAIMLQSSSEQQQGSLFAFDWIDESSKFDSGTVAGFHNDMLVAEGTGTALTTFLGTAERFYWVSQMYSGDGNTWFLASSPSDLESIMPSQASVGYNVYDGSWDGCFVSKELFVTSTHLWLQCQADPDDLYDAPATLEARELSSMGGNDIPYDLLMSATQGLSSVEPESLQMLAMTDNMLIRAGSDWDSGEMKVYSSAYSSGTGSSVNVGSTQSILDLGDQSGMNSGMSDPTFVYQGDLAFIAVQDSTQGGGFQDYQIHAMSISGGEVSAPTIAVEEGMVTSMAISPDGRFLYWSQSGALGAGPPSGDNGGSSYPMELYRALIQ
jgi:hypothetical protein